MGERKEDITVRIRTDYAKAMADMQRFTGSADQAFGGLPKVVQGVITSVDKLTGRIDKVDTAFSALPKTVQGVTQSVDRLTEMVEKLGQAAGPGKLKTKLREANEEASTLSKTLSMVATGGKAVGAAMAGWQAGKMVLMPHLEKQMDYSTKLAHLANTTYSDKSVTERISGKSDLNKSILAATRSGGGTRDDALGALDKMIASGAVSAKDAKSMLPSVVRGATASGASPEEIASIAIRGMQNFGFKAEDLPAVIDMAIKSGQMGGFELKDMAKWLPQQMAEAATLGMKGKQGFAQLLSLNQASITAAGTTDGAGNNVVNLLAKINSDDTQKDFKKQGINLTGKLQEGVGKGVDPISTFSMLIDGIMKKDKVYQALEAKLKKAGTDKEKTDIIDQQLQLAQGTAIGKVLQDRQARSAFLGYKKQGDAFGKMTDATLNGSAGTTDSNFAVVESETGFKRQQALNEELNAQTVALTKLNPALNTYYDYVTKNAKIYPELTTALEGGKLAVTTLAAGTGAASVVMMMLTKNATAASVALGGVAGAGGTKNLPGGPGIGGAGIKNLLKANGAMALAYGAYDVYGIASNDNLSKQEKKIGYTGAVGGALGGTAGGALAGAALGSILPVVGTTIGALIGGGIGYWGGNKIGTSAGEAMFGDGDEKAKQTYLDNLKTQGALNSPESKRWVDMAFNPLAAPGMSGMTNAAPPFAASSLFGQAPGTSMQRQMGNAGTNMDAMQRALSDGLKPLPIDARIKLDVSFNEQGKPYVQQQSVTGTGVRLDVGPMMMN